MKFKFFGSLSPDLSIAYIANHKAGSTAVTCALAELGYSQRGMHEINASSAKYIFSFTRNPYSRLFSRYMHLKDSVSKLEVGTLKRGSQAHKSVNVLLEKKVINSDGFMFDDFVKFAINNFDPHWEPQVEKFERQFYSLKNINFIGKMENLQAEYNAVCNEIGIQKKTLRIVNKRAHKHYSEYYNQELIEIVSKWYKRDLDEFGYKFNDS